MSAQTLLETVVPQETPLMDVIKGYLKDLTRSAQVAHNWTSFSPDKRGTQMIDGYTALLIENVEEMTAKGVSGSSCLWYASKFRGLLSVWIARKSRCASSVITGGSGFNVRRAEKANRSEHAAGETFHKWESYMMKRLIRQAQPHKTNDSEILRLRGEVEQMEQDQRIMKRLNVLYPKWKKEMSKIVTDNHTLIQDRMKEFAELHGISIPQVNTLRKHVPSYNTQTKVFPSFMLTNNNNRIKGAIARIKELETREAAKDMESKEIAFEGGRIEISYKSERINIYFDERIEREEFMKYKKHGFKWSRSYTCFTRQLTENALFTMRHYLFPNLEIPKRAY